ncbi:YndM family protein [Bacillus salitolerans]|uniref:YndM family protein n=1 Tax=Bacillus salitolerans TaxID=1437434 RepID=A0ABW4LQV9_9BACI
MSHLPVLLMKFISSVLIFTIALDLFFEASFVDILSFSLLLTVFSYFIGDQILLPRIGNANAIISDFFLAYVTVWIFGSILLHSYLQIAWGSIITASFVAVSELFVHRYMLRRSPIAQETQRSAFNERLAYGMEMAEEQNPRDKK